MQTIVSWVLLSALLFGFAADKDISVVVDAFQNFQSFASYDAAAAVAAAVDPKNRHKIASNASNNHVHSLSRRDVNDSSDIHKKNDNPKHEEPINYKGSSSNSDTESESESSSFLLEYSIDSFLRGDYDRTFAEDAASPLPGLSPFETVDAALRSLRDLDVPEASHGAAVFLRFCAELKRGERWGTATTTTSWKELLRGSLTPTMLARRIRASEEFSGLLDWTRLEVGCCDGIVGDGEYTTEANRDAAFQNENVACIDATISFGGDELRKSKAAAAPSPPEVAVPTTTTTTMPREIYRFELAKMLGGVWLIDSGRKLPSSTKRSRTTTRGTENPGPSRKTQQRGNPRRRQRNRKDNREDNNNPGKRNRK